MTSVDVSAEESEDPTGMALSPRPVRDVWCSRMVRGVVVVAVVAMSVACSDDGSPSDAPTETPGTGSGGSVTTVPADTPSGGSGAVEPGTNLVPSSDAGPPGSGSQDPGLGASQTTAGG
jgi:hypothetical protein